MEDETSKHHRIDVLAVQRSNRVAHGIFCLLFSGVAVSHHPQIIQQLLFPKSYRPEGQSHVADEPFHQWHFAELPRTLHEMQEQDSCSRNPCKRPCRAYRRLPTEAPG